MLSWILLKDGMSFVCDGFTNFWILHIEMTVSYRPLRILQIPLCKILHFCTGGYKENCLLGCGAIFSGSGGHCFRGSCNAHLQGS